MLSKIKAMLFPFTFESQEMKNSYLSLHNDNEKKLITLLNLMLITFSLIFLALGLVNQVEHQMIISRTISLSVSILALVLRTKLPIIQKMLVLGVIGVTTARFIVNLEFFCKNRITCGFVIGNAMGLIELSVIWSLKEIRLRLVLIAVFFGAKLIFLSKEFVNTLATGITIFALIVSILIFFFFDNMLERKNFKVVYESKEKVKNLQTLITDDLSTIIVIIDSDLNQVLFSNNAFLEILTKENHVPNYQKEIRIFERFIVDQSTNTEFEYSGGELSLTNFLHNLNSNPLTQITGINPLTFSAIFKNDKDNEVYYEIKLRKIVWDGKSSYSMVLNDVSDKQKIIALKLSDEQKEKVIATVSHELRTPINGILGLLEMVGMRTTDTLSLDYLEYAKSCSKLLLYLVNSILDLDQIRNNCLRISRESFNIERFLEELKSLYIFHSQQKGIDFEIIMESSVPKEIYTDKYRLIEILINLIGNAMKFTFQGSITLSISVDKDDSHKLVFCVEDTGIGIREEDKPKLFQMFGKINHHDKSINTQGVGLGLMISNELVKILNDNGLSQTEEKIHFESEFGKGTKFYFRIDALFEISSNSSFSQLSMNLSQHDLNTPDIKERSTISPNQFCNKIMQYSTPSYLMNKKKLSKFATKDNEDEVASQRKLLSPKFDSAKCILLVDDNPFNLVAAAFIFGQFGYSTIKAFNGQEGLDLLEQSQRCNKKYCMVLTDIEMPVLDGLEMSRIINLSIERGETYYVPVVAVTAKKLSEKEKIQYREYGIEETLEKPLIQKEVKAILERLSLL